MTRKGVLVLGLICAVNTVVGCPPHHFKPLTGCEEGYTSPSTPIQSTPVTSAVQCITACYQTDGCNAISVCTDSGLLTCSLYSSGSDGTCASLSPTPGCRYMELMIQCPGFQHYDASLRECVCSSVWLTGPDCDTYYKDCSEATNDGLTDPSDFKTIQIKPTISDNPFEVRCYLQWGGWTEIEKRNTECPDDFTNLDWSMFRDGFGNFSCSFFLGLDKIYQILKNGEYQLNAHVTGEDDLHGHAYYNNFRLDDESSKYMMDWDNYEVNQAEPAEDGFDFGGPNYNLKGKSFGTHDRPDSNNCAASEGTGWWYGDNCPYVNLHMPLNASLTGATGSASWPKGGILQNLRSFTLQLKRTA